MITYPRICVALSLLILLTAITPKVSAQASDPLLLRNEYIVDWTTAELIIRTTRKVETQGGNAPIAVHLTEREADYSLPQLLHTALHGLQRDTVDTVGSATADTPAIAAEITRLVPHVQRSSSRRSRDLSELTVEYRLPLFPAATELFGLHEVSSPLPRNLQRVPTREFTGIIVYVADSLQVHGTTRTDLLQGALFPRIYDTEMNVVLEPGMMDPDYLQQWGPVAYSTDAQPADHEERIGSDPLRILARGIFGTTATDLLISTTDAARILSQPTNLSLLREGRVVLVVAPDSARVQIQP
ncbi:MAG: hypothetical protein EA428_07915 [Spirochaetaceae bacterium]|nr:MAG: hypothetical protein EA428_07915 [Spirochaetaceae bacterium]